MHWRKVASSTNWKIDEYLLNSLYLQENLAVLKIYSKINSPRVNHFSHALSPYLSTSWSKSAYSSRGLVIYCKYRLLPANQTQPLIFARQSAWILNASCEWSKKKKTRITLYSNSRKSCTLWMVLHGSKKENGDKIILVIPVVSCFCSIHNKIVCH